MDWRGVGIVGKGQKEPCLEELCPILRYKVDLPSHEKHVTGTTSSPVFLGDSPRL